VAQLVVMGSGETAPTMVRTHRAVLAATPDGARTMLDTTFGFQVNADDLVARTRAYFADSVGTPVEVASWRRGDLPVIEQERALAAIGASSWVFAGPGSPSYALRQWEGTAVPAALAEVPARGGTLVFGSAAVVTLGTHAIPVYEIYKAGEDPGWLEGLDLLGALTGIRAAVVPHFDNREGGGYDTRFCYLGEPRLAAMEQLLPDDVGVLGVDEHTALLLDLDADVARVAGSGVVTVRRRGHAVTFGDGASLPLPELRALLAGAEALEEAVGSGAVAMREVASLDGGTGDDDDGRGGAISLRADVEALDAQFDEALARRDVDAAVTCVLEAEQAIHDWQGDTLQSDDADVARRRLRSMVVRLGALALTGARDPHEVAAPYVEALLTVRGRAREARDFATSDLVRDALASAGVEVRDTPDGVSWSLRQSADGA
jgi:hypothetical protein